MKTANSGQSCPKCALTNSIEVEKTQTTHCYKQILLKKAPKFTAILSPNLNFSHSCNNT